MAKAFEVPSLADADSEYGALSERYTTLSNELAQISRDADDLEADIRARRAPAMRPGVAELIGETVDLSLLERPKRLRELRQRAADLEQAVEIIRRRRDDRLGAASLAACKIAKGEYAKRIGKFVAALEAAKFAYDEAESVLDALEREGVQIGYMPTARTSFFAGNDNGVTRFVSEAKGNGHVN
ncbi:hypothetical protein A6U87_17590 [Rhizobium sp. AC44/96]|uniref:hypothetical protein n=1 Tax=Rhizobium sp. AC44/96 TaxID=1841654 RepID=UPI0008101068|nr:hypothetical protein [Rhizobium sp. AC44/96]OCJ03748.1 hypothetical protein A6U87_17590 [Rhizobium sp. AC44/96]